MSASTAVVPEYVAGAWKISSANSGVQFTVRHLGVVKVHGRFNDVDGIIVTDEVPERSSVTATISAGSVNTGFPARDAYVRGDDVLAADKHHELRFASTRARVAGGSLLVDGDLTVRNAIKPVTLTVEIGGVGDDPVEHVQVLGLSAITTLRRADFGLAPEVPALIVGEEVTVKLDILAVRDF